MSSKRRLTTGRSRWNSPSPLRPAHASPDGRGFPKACWRASRRLDSPRGGYRDRAHGRRHWRRLLHQRRTQYPGVVMTTPSALRRSVLLAKAVADQPSGVPWLAGVDKAGSPIRDGWTWRQMARFLPCPLRAGSLHEPWSPGARHRPFGREPRPMFFVHGRALRLAACAAVPTRRTAPRNPGGPRVRLCPSYTIIVALLSREQGRVANFSPPSRRLDYPRGQARHQARARGGRPGDAGARSPPLRLPGHVEIIVAPPGFPRTKPRALNVALPLARGTIHRRLRCGGRARSGAAASRRCRLCSNRAARSPACRRA